jgi:DNA-directed RNA polymerase specialized sigma24 family protein
MNTALSPKVGLSIQQQIQNVSREFFEIKSNKKSTEIEVKRAFNKYYDILVKTVFSVSIRVLRDYDLAWDNVNKVFLKIYNNENFIFNDTKSHFSYVWTVTHHSALMQFNKLKKDKLINESTLRKYLSEDNEIESLLDVIYTKNSGNFDTIDFEFSYIHNSVDLKHDRILKIINRLGEENPEILKDALVDSVNYEKVALKHGLNTAGAVKTRVFRAKKIIRRELEKEISGANLADGERITGEVKYYHDDSDQVKYIANVESGVLNGAFSKFHKNGVLAVEGSHLGGKLNGQYKEYYEDGTLKMSGTYKSGKKDSVWERFNADGSFDRKNEYHNGEVAYYEFINEEGRRECGIVADNAVTSQEELVPVEA